MTNRMNLRRLSMAAGISAALMFSVPACAQTTEALPEAAQAANAPAKVEKNADTGIAKITLTERAMERLDMKTDTVKAGAGTDITFPYSALIYQADGTTWVYTNPAPGVFQRQGVTVSRVEGGVVTATAGPAVDTPVVTVGATELFGAEFDSEK